jgi:DNA-binding response OmpR family regulator
MIVEDEPDLAELYAHSLRLAGHEALIARDGLSACRLISAERPDLILLDLLLPDLDGLEICRLLRGHADTALAATPIIVLTALDSTSDRQKALQLGVDAYLTKPCSLRELHLRVGQLAPRGRRQPLSGATEGRAR